MKKTNSTQKKRVTLNYIYATLVGLLVIACALTIAFVTRQGRVTNLPQDVGQVAPDQPSIEVSSTTYVLPMQNGTIVKDYSSKELQYNDTLKQWQIHKAVDMVSETSTEVLALTNGKVTNIYTNYLEGTVVEITHADGLKSVYKSLDKDVKVSVGDSVAAGQVIGSVSESMTEELNTGAHLHLEVLLNGVKVDPNNYFTLANK